MKDMTEKEAEKWIDQEFEKILNKADAKKRVAEIEHSMNGFWKTPAGIEAGKKFPVSRNATVMFYNAIKFAYKLK